MEQQLYIMRKESQQADVSRQLTAHEQELNYERLQQELDSCIAQLLDEQGRVAALRQRDVSLQERAAELSEQLSITQKRLTEAQADAARAVSKANASQQDATQAIAVNELHISELQHQVQQMRDMEQQRHEEHLAQVAELTATCTRLRREQALQEEEKEQLLKSERLKMSAELRSMAEALQEARSARDQALALARQEADAHQNTQTTLGLESPYGQPRPSFSQVQAAQGEFAAASAYYAALSPRNSMPLSPAVQAAEAENRLRALSPGLRASPLPRTSPSLSPAQSRQTSLYSQEDNRLWSSAAYPETPRQRIAAAVARCAVLRTLDVGSHSDPGNRYAGQNQDFLVVTEMYNAGEIPRDGEQTYILAVCDGKALARNLLTSSLRNKHIGRMAPQDVMEAVKAAFTKASQAANAVYSLPPKTVDYLASPGSRCLVQYTLQDSQASVKHYRTAKGHEKLLECGTTATTVVLQGGVLCLANVGDSLAVLGVDQGPGQGLSGHFITCRHFGLNPEEAERIRQQHATTTEVLEDGYVRVVEGQWAGYELAVTRALGHLHMAQYGIIDTPFVTLLRLTHVNPCLVRADLRNSRLVCWKMPMQILASDGVWDMVGADEAVAHVMASLAQGLSAGEAAKALVQLAVSRGLASPDGRQDNTSAIVVSLVDRLPIPEEAGEAEAV
ncbi:hypothetical protein QJQ45_009693 [Haematococcus lacustris]|nr:hypothetical protein QJQ45_009693 [Haematococcus lacustris]